MEDDEAIRSFLVDALDEERYDVRVANNGLEGLETLRAWRPDIILLDLLMPEMDGWTFRREQQSLPEYADIPVVVMSAGRNLQGSSGTMGAVALFEKPFDLEAMLGVVRAHATGAREPEAPR